MFEEDIDMDSRAITLDATGRYVIKATNRKQSLLTVQYKLVTVIEVPAYLDLC